MKRTNKLLNLALSICLIIVAGFSSGCLVPGERGDGHVIKQDRKTSSFEGIDVSGAFDIILSQGPVQSVVVEADENLMKYISTEVDQGNLVIEEKKPIQHANTLKVYVTVPSLKSIELSGAVDASTVGALKFPELSISASGATDSKFNLDVQTLSVDCSGGSKLKFQGKAANTQMEVSGAVDLFAYDLETDSFNLKISGAGKAQINVKKELNVDISGAGTVRYKGNPEKVNQDISGAGSVKKAEE